MTLCKRHGWLPLFSCHALRGLSCKELSLKAGQLEKATLKTSSGQEVQNSEFAEIPNPHDKTGLQNWRRLNFL